MKIFLSAVEHGGPGQALKCFLSGGDSGTPKSAMKIMLSSTEFGANKDALKSSMQSENPLNNGELLWNLMSYYYLRTDEEWACKIRDSSRLVMIDSGAHSFQKGKKVEWDEYTQEYAEFIKRFDRNNVVGYFEMDVDNIIGYEKVLALRELLKQRSGHPDKIIPVWHKNRGVADFKKMCEEHSGRIVAITGFKNGDIKDEQYPLFLKEAWKHNCKIHCLGMTRKEILDSVPFDYVDSSSWAQSAIYGRIGSKKVTRECSKTNRNDVFIAAYQEAMKMQKHYWLKWRGVCKDEF